MGVFVLLMSSIFAHPFKISRWDVLESHHRVGLFGSVKPLSVSALQGVFILHYQADSRPVF